MTQRSLGLRQDTRRCTTYIALRKDPELRGSGVCRSVSFTLALIDDLDGLDVWVGLEREQVPLIDGEHPRGPSACAGTKMPPLLMNDRRRIANGSVRVFVAVTSRRRVMTPLRLRISERDSARAPRAQMSY